MVNNEFHIIGIAVSDFQDIGNDRFSSYLLRVEVEKLNSKYGKNFTLEVQIYGTNKAIDTTQDIKGCQIVVNGYLDSYMTQQETIVNKIIAQNIYVLDNQQPRSETVVQQSTVAPSSKSVDEDWETTANELGMLDKSPRHESEVQLSDDDLPF